MGNQLRLVEIFALARPVMFITGSIWVYLLSSRFPRSFALPLRFMALGFWVMAFTGLVVTLSATNAPLADPFPDWLTEACVYVGLLAAAFVITGLVVFMNRAIGWSKQFAFDMRQIREVREAQLKEKEK
jgi:hypothetical protein